MKKRIIPSILLKGGTQVTLSKKFKPWRSVGALIQNLRLHINRQADELLIINLDNAGKEFSLPNRILKLIRKEVDIPISYVGGISSIQDASSCINAGFDRVFITSEFIKNPEKISGISNIIGAQSLGISIPYCRSLENHNLYYVFDYQGKRTLDLKLTEAIKKSLALGVGEILLHSVDNDGTLNGFDHGIIDILDNLSPQIPVILAGGAGSAQDVYKVLASSWVQGVVAGSIFALTKETPSTIRQFCKLKGLEMRRISY